MTTINTNTITINSQRALKSNSAALGTTMARLSSGLRVNSAADDAAGLAIAARMNAQAKGAAVASRNANDGISLGQTAEGSLGKIEEMLQRMRELAVQSSNTTNSKKDRESLQEEVNQLRDEIDRVAKTTSFNGRKLLDGSFSGAYFQVGENAGDNITVGALADTRVAKLSAVKFSGNAKWDATTGVKTITGGADAVDLTDAKVTNFGKDVAAGTLKISVNGTDYELGALKAAASGAERAGQAVAAINAKTADTGVAAFLNKNEKDGNYTIEVRSATLSADGTKVAEVTFTGFTEADTGIKADLLKVNATDANKFTKVGIEDISVETQASAWEAIAHIDSAIDQVNKSRGTLGAIQNRFTKTIENIDVMTENVTAARGRIIDADFAKETASLSRTQVLQQAGMAMVAQANQIPQQVLSLLR